MLDLIIENLDRSQSVAEIFDNLESSWKDVEAYILKLAAENARLRERIAELEKQNEAHTDP